MPQAGTQSGPAERLTRPSAFRVLQVGVWLYVSFALADGAGRMMQAWARQGMMPFWFAKLLYVAFLGLSVFAWYLVLPGCRFLAPAGRGRADRGGQVLCWLVVIVNFTAVGAMELISRL